jgi:hypothetical protein
LSIHTSNGNVNAYYEVVDHEVDIEVHRLGEEVSRVPGEVVSLHGYSQKTHWALKGWIWRNMKQRLT